jgi:sugar-specific transcriptional regulator TrmB
MPDATDNALGRARKILEDRLTELDAERRQVERALTEISGGKAGRRGPGRPRGSRSRRRGSTRADEAVGVVTSSPGISASEIAKKLKIAPNYMYRVMSDLVKEGRVRKSGRGYHPT